MFAITADTSDITNLFERFLVLQAAVLHLLFSVPLPICIILLTNQSAFYVKSVHSQVISSNTLLKKMLSCKVSHEIGLLSNSTVHVWLSQMQLSCLAVPVQLLQLMLESGPSLVDFTHRFSVCRLDYRASQGNMELLKECSFCLVVKLFLVYFLVAVFRTPQTMLVINSIQLNPITEQRS